MTIYWRHVGSQLPSQENDIHINTLKPRQNGRHFADDIFKCILLNENIWITINNSLKFVPKGPINNIPPLVQIMAWRRPGDKPLFEPMMVSLLTHICVNRPNELIRSLQLSSKLWYLNMSFRGRALQTKGVFWWYFCPLNLIVVIGMSCESINTLNDNLTF